MNEELLTNAPQQASALPLGGPGANLRRAREAAKMELQAIARQLYLTEYVINALENDEYHKLPGLTFTRGYLRSYAKLVNLSPDEIMEQFNQLGLTEKPLHQLNLPLYKMQPSLNERHIRLISYAVIFGLVLLVGLWWRSHKAPTEAVNTPLMNHVNTISSELNNHQGQTVNTAPTSQTLVPINTPAAAINSPVNNVTSAVINDNSATIPAETTAATTPDATNNGADNSKNSNAESNDGVPQKISKEKQSKRSQALLNKPFE